MAGNPLAVQEYRKDGWPLCPQCGEDELYSCAGLIKAHDQGTASFTIEEAFAGEFVCYRCNWRGRIEPRAP